jgi:hypothetical protein
LEHLDDGYITTDLEDESVAHLARREANASDLVPSHALDTCDGEQGTADASRPGVFDGAEWTY